jgi:hypothetical protein
MSQYEVDTEEGTIYIETTPPPGRCVKVEVVMSGLWAGFYLGQHEARELAEKLLRAVGEDDRPEVLPVGHSTCPKCGAANPIVQPDDGLWCFGCGHIWKRGGPK